MGVCVETDIILPIPRTCFLPWYEVNNSEQLRKILGDALPSGALVCNLESTDIKSFMMSLCSKF